MRLTTTVSPGSGAIAARIAKPGSPGLQIAGRPDRGAGCRSPSRRLTRALLRSVAMFATTFVGPKDRRLLPGTEHRLLHVDHQQSGRQRSTSDQPLFRSWPHYALCQARRDPHQALHCGWGELDFGRLLGADAGARTGQTGQHLVMVGDDLLGRQHAVVQVLCASLASVTLNLPVQGRAGRGIDTEFGLHPAERQCSTPASRRSDSSSVPQKASQAGLVDHCLAVATARWPDGPRIRDDPAASARIRAPDGGR